MNNYADTFESVKTGSGVAHDNPLISRDLLNEDG
jgi:hypothetical protein